MICDIDAIMKKPKVKFDAAAPGQYIMPRSPHDAAAVEACE
jgi:hypothetical protein